MHLDETNVSCVCVHVCAVLMCVWVHVCVGWAFIIVFTVSSPQEESRMFLIWEKALSLLVRQVKFSGSVANIPTQLSNLASLLQRFGEDKASDGLLGVIGLGKKSLYSLQ